MLEVVKEHYNFSLSLFLSLPPPSPLPPLLPLPYSFLALSPILPGHNQAGLSEDQVCEKQRSVMAGLPEFGVKDMASWFRFVVLSRPILLQGLQVRQPINAIHGLLYLIRAHCVLSVSVSECM